MAHNNMDISNLQVLLPFLHGTVIVSLNLGFYSSWVRFLLEKLVLVGGFNYYKSACYHTSN